MQRVTLALEDKRMFEIDRLISVLRDLARVGFGHAAVESSPDQEGVAALVYVDDQTSR
jgi:hypothetical protein